MKKLIGILFAAGIISGCTNSAKEVLFPVLPQELKDCKVFFLTNEGGGALTVMRCPNATTSTSYTSGKSTVTSIVVDGVEYQPVPKNKE